MSSDERSMDGLERVSKGHTPDPVHYATRASRVIATTSASRALKSPWM